jgi:uncharacterized membrane protein YuzA (DUF378 family)
MTNRNRTLDDVSWALTGLGALAWGLRAVANFDLIGSLFGTDTPMSRYLYGLIGLAGLWSLQHILESSTRRTGISIPMR